MIAVGDAAPDFTLRSHQGDEISLAGFKGDKWVVPDPAAALRKLKELQA